jgi:hypothetical protein
MLFVISAGVHWGLIEVLKLLPGWASAGAVKRQAVIDTALEEIDIRDNPTEHLTPLNVKTSIVSDKRLDWRELLQPDNSTPLEKPDERNLTKMLDATQDEPLALVKIAVPGQGLTPIPRLGAQTEGKTSVAAVVDALARELGKMIAVRNVLLVWLFDESISMRESQQEIRDRVSKLYAELAGDANAGGQPKLVSVVVGYGKDVHFFLEQPSAVPDQVKAAIERVPPDTSGRENVMLACLTAMRKYQKMAEVQRRKLVLFVVTDEMGDDTGHVEEVLAMAHGARPPASVFVLGSEALFQKTRGVAYATQPQTGQRVPNLVAVGPESAAKEVLEGYVENAGPYSGAWLTKSGFGFWALSRLAKETGGMYYLLYGQQGPAYDPDVMAAYAPELCAAAEYEARCRPNAGRLRFIIHNLHFILEEVPFGWPDDPQYVADRLRPIWEQDRFYNRISPDNLQGDIAEARRLAARRLAKLNELVGILEKGSLANDPYAPRRWEANRELALADCYALRWSAQQYLYAIDDFVRAGRLNPAAEYYVVRTDDYYHKHPVRGTNGQKTLEEVQAKYEAVIAHHPGTPWAACAQARRRIDRYEVEAYVTPPPSDYTPPPQPPPPPEL